MYLVPEVPVVPVVPENLISDILVSPPFQKYITPMVNSEKNLIRAEMSIWGGGHLPIPKIAPSLPTQQNKSLPWRNIAVVLYMVQISGTLQAKKPK